MKAETGKSGNIFLRFISACIAGALIAPVVLSQETVNPGFITELLFANNELPGISQSPYLSPAALALSPDGKTVYVAEYTAKRIDFVDVQSKAITKSVLLPKNPTGIAVSSDGSKLHVTGFWPTRPQSLLMVISTATGTIEKNIVAGHSARSPVISKDGGIVYVCNRFADHISAIDVAQEKIAATVAVQREPYAAAITPDGKSLVVANYLPIGRSDVTVQMANVSIINTETNKLAANVPLTNGAQSMPGVCISPDGKYAYISHVRSNFTQTPLKPITGGWINANAVGIVDIANRKYENVVILDDGLLGGAANPWGIACTEDYLCVLTSGSQEIHVMDRKKLHTELAAVAGQEEDMSYSLTFSLGFTKRMNVSVKGPRSIAMSGTNVYIGGYFSDQLEMLTLNAGAASKAATIDLAPQQSMDIVRKGEYNFCDATRLCLGKWQTCTSCHPDGRSDALKWDLENDGDGNFKNDKSLLFSHITPPSMITGVRERAEVATRKGIELILFIDPGSVEEEAQAIDAYLKQLRPVPSPLLDNGRFSEAAIRGKKVFEKLNCASCHPKATYYTDMKKHAGVKGVDDHGPYDGNWDTPTLIENWRSAPYFHDGRAATMKELYIAPIKHGIFSTALSEQEIADLVEFVNSL